MAQVDDYLSGLEGWVLLISGSGLRLVNKAREESHVN